MTLLSELYRGLIHSVAMELFNLNGVDVGKISKVVRIGLVVNILWFSVVWYSTVMAQDVYDQLSYSERQLFEVISFLIVPFAISLTVQIISLPVLFKMPKLGLTLAIISSFLMLPVSMIFVVGYLFSYEKRRNKGLTPYIAKEGNRPDGELNFDTSKFALLGVMFIVVGLVVGFIGVSVGWIVACSGVVALSNSFRLKKHVMIGLLRDKLIITPALYAETYLVELSDVTLFKEDKKLFKVQINSAGVNRKCTVRKNMIKEENPESVLEGILSKLAKQANAGTVAE